MPDRFIVKIARLRAGDEASRPVVLGGIIGGVIPVDGFIVTTNHPSQMPIYIRDTDLTKAKDIAERMGRPVVTMAESWDDKSEEDK